MDISMDIIKQAYEVIISVAENSSNFMRKDLSCACFLFNVDYGKGYVVREMIVTSFISEADGKRYCYLEPNVIWYVAHFKHIKGISPDITLAPWN